MHGLIFVTWEKYLSERFGPSLLQRYRTSRGETLANAPLASRVYDDAMLLAGVGEAHRLTGFPRDTLLLEYGRYFIQNGLTRHLCTYLLAQVHSGRDLLLCMRQAHAQMRLTPDALTPPLFAYEALPGEGNGALRLLYDSTRQLCPLLKGAIEGAAQRYDEQVFILEQTCMRQGASVCSFEIHFSSASPTPSLPQETAQQKALRERHQQLAALVLQALPTTGGLTWVELLERLRCLYAAQDMLRPSTLLEALQHLQHAGLVSSSSHLPGDTMDGRRYWRAPLLSANERGFQV